MNLSFLFLHICRVISEFFWKSCLVYHCAFQPFGRAPPCEMATELCMWEEQWGQAGPTSDKQDSLRLPCDTSDDQVERSRS